MGKLKATFNRDSENYFKLSTDENTIRDLLEVLRNLKITDHFEQEGNKLSGKYEEWVGHHEYFSNEEYNIHIIFEEKNVHLVVKCDEGRRTKFLDALQTKFPLN